MHILILFKSVMSSVFLNGNKSLISEVCLKFGKGAFKEYEFWMFLRMELLGIVNQYKLRESIDYNTVSIVVYKFFNTSNKKWD